MVRANIFALVAVVAACVGLGPTEGRFLTERKSIDLAVEVDVDHCKNTPFGKWKLFCYVVDDLTRLVVDPRRTLNIAQDGVGKLVHYTLDIFMSARKLGNIAQGMVVLPLGVLFDSAHITGYWVSTITERISSLVDGFEHFMKHARFWHLLYYGGLPIYCPVGVVDSTVHGVIEGLNRSGLEQVSNLLKGIERIIDNLLIWIVKTWYNMMFESIDCSDQFPSRFCTVAGVLYHKAVDQFWNFVNPVRAVAGKMVKVLLAFLEDIHDHWKEVFEKYCHILLPSHVCRTIVDLVPTTIAKAKEEFNSLSSVIGDVNAWIRKHIFEDIMPNEEQADNWNNMIYQ